MTHLEAEINARINIRGKLSQFFKTGEIDQQTWNKSRQLKFEMHVLNCWRGRTRIKKS